MTIDSVQPEVIESVPAPARVGLLDCGGALVEPETPGRRRAILIAAVLFAAGYFWVLGQFWAPAHGGVDQNGYLVAGKMLAEHGSTAQRPADLFSYVSSMWICTPDQVFYPKYPIGLPAIYAAVLKIAGHVNGASAVNWAYRVSPLAMTGGLLGAFLILRMIVGSFPGLLGMIALACSPVTLELTNNPNSHAASFLFVTWGMYFLLCWWDAGGPVRAILAGLLLGYAATIRYSEGLLILCILLPVACNLRPRGRARWIETALLLGWWAIPILAVICFNLASFGRITGYDYTHESTGFSVENFATNWEPMVRQMYQTGFFFLLPFGFMGLVLLPFRNWRVGLWLIGWLVPGVVIYTAYYWAPDNQQIVSQNVGYLRFFLTILPPLAIGAFWVVGQVCTMAARSTQSRAPVIGVTIASGLLVAVAGAMGITQAAAPLEGAFNTTLSLARAGSFITHEDRLFGPLGTPDTQSPAGVPDGSVIFCAVDNLLNHLQFISNDQLYSTRAFDPSYIRSLANIDPSGPREMQPERAQNLLAAAGSMTAGQLLGEQIKIIRRAFSQGRRVFWIVQSNRFSTARNKTYPGTSFGVKLEGIWTEMQPVTPLPAAVAGGAVAARGGISAPGVVVRGETNSAGERVSGGAAIGSGRATTAPLNLVDVTSGPPLIIWQIVEILPEQTGPNQTP